jgi:hypothetical protein
VTSGNSPDNEGAGSDPQLTRARRRKPAGFFLSFEQIRQQRVTYHAPKQTDRPYENATYRARLDRADTDDDANESNEGSTTKQQINKVGSSPHREGENDAAQLLAETAGSPERIDSHDN